MADAHRSTSPKKTFGDLEMDDVDDLEEDLGEIQLGPSFMKSMKYVDARPLTLKKASELKSLIFGSPSGCFNEEWMKQGFPFNDRPDLEFGIVQHKGGSCGVLASVQACFLQNLLFMDDRIISPGDLRPGKREQNKCLAKALAKILWQCGSEKRVILSMPSGKVQFTTGGRYKGDSLTETLMLYHFTSLPDLEEYLNVNIGFFINPTGNGVVVFLYSVIFSKSLEGIIDEMDEPTNQLMGHHNYCTQEMVNLILTGRAVSNVFNDIMELDSGTGPKCILKGLNKRSDVGLLSLFEHYGSCKVGSYYKTPRLPVWVICSESHFSVLFSLKRNLLSDWKAERNFDLYYYDGLSNQEEAIRLSVNTIASCPPSDDGDLVPPMEHCIRTKAKFGVTRKL
ncbi:hypothetical protein BSL78_23155 [Apostichopus japonicus]|uniref:Ubiquitin carboxyl-terminal hydrolase MINDY n=1 Tax=Stichopus japonicus TaxID=307972 RepID=A0A2G8JW86_STIJA|nr:hypothetical protein BSL78_23155 [Apostichopus japonicus]